MSSFLSKVDELSATLTECGQVISDELTVVTVLNGLPPKYDTFVDIANQRHPAYKYAELKIALLNQEDIFQKKEETECDQISNVNEKRNFKKKKFKPKNDSSVKWCDYHKSATHNASECYNKDKHEIHQASVVVEEYNYESCDEFSFHIANDSKRDEEFILIDSGCSSHIEKDKSKFSNIKESQGSSRQLSLADGRKLPDAVKGVGTALEHVQSSSGDNVKLRLENSLYVPCIKQDIISVSKAVSGGNTVVFSPDGSYILLKDGKKIEMINKNDLYFIKRSSDTCNQVTWKENSLEGWHRRLGHCNVADLKKLEKNVEGMKITSEEKFQCQTCILGKMTNPVSTEPRERCSNNMELIHCDIVGAISPISKEGFKYSINFVDDCSGAVWIHFLKQKSDAHLALEKFIAQASRFGVIRRLRCDHGTEFTSDLFRSVCISNQIALEFSSPRSPHQNGTAERNHRTIYEMVRCLLHDAKLPKMMWPYAVRMAACIRNRCINSRIGITPYEKLRGRRPDMSKLQTFGCKCFAFKENSGKLDAKCVEGVYVGPDPESAAHLIYFPSTQSVRKVRNVKFVREKPLVQEVPQFLEMDESHLRAIPEGMGEQPCNHEAGENSTCSTDTDEGNSNTAELDNTEEPRYPTRERKPPARLEDYVVNSAEETLIDQCFYLSQASSIPTTYQQAISSPRGENWRKAMDEEMASLIENETYDLVELPEDRKIVNSKWVYTIKPGIEGEEKHKARFVARGFTQEKMVDYNETFSPTAKMTSLRAFLQVAASLSLIVHQMDVCTAFLNADIDYDIYVKQPEGYEKTTEDGKPLYCKLKKSLYGLKQSGRMWNHKINSFFINNGFTQSKVDSCIYTKHEGDKVIIILLWVDDILIASSCAQLLDQFKSLLKQSFKMKDLGLVKWFLGISFEFNDNCISINQSKYIAKILERFQMSDAYPVSTPCDASFANQIHAESEFLQDPTLYRAIVGSLIYIMVATRPDLSYVVTKLSQFMSAPTKSHLSVAKRCLRYLKGTCEYGLNFSKSNENLKLIGFSDSDWGNSDDCKSISGFCFQLQSNGPLISWKSKKQPVVALSSCEAEYVALTNTIQEGKFLKQLMMDLLNVHDFTVDIMVDNQSAMKLAKNPVFHQRSKHINIKYHFIREEIFNKTVFIHYVPTCSNVADIFTKPVNCSKLKRFSCIRGS